MTGWRRGRPAGAGRGRAPPGCGRALRAAGLGSALLAPLALLGAPALAKGPEGLARPAVAPPPRARAAGRAAAGGGAGPSEASGCPFTSSVRSWVDDFVLRNNLCPWAVRSADEGDLRVVASTAETPLGALSFLHEEAMRLRSQDPERLATTLVVCPEVEAWGDFDAFEAYLRVWNSRLEKLAPKGTHSGSFMKDEEADALSPGQEEELLQKLREIKEHFHLEAFHPGFSRWSCPEGGFQTGSSVLIDPFDLREVANPKYKGLRVEVVNTDPAAVGARKMAVRLETGEVQICESRAVLDSSQGSPTPENAMQRAPHATVHLIAKKDLDYKLEEVNSLRLRNSERVTELWRAGELGSWP